MAAAWLIKEENRAERRRKCARCGTPERLREPERESSVPACVVVAAAVAPSPTASLSVAVASVNAQR